MLVVCQLLKCIFFLSLLQILSLSASAYKKKLAYKMTQIFKTSHTLLFLTDIYARLK